MLPTELMVPVENMTLIVVERERHWSALCERHWGTPFVNMVECRTMLAASEQLDRSPWSVVAIDVHLVPRCGLIPSLYVLRRKAPHAVVSLLGRAESKSVEWELRAAGATAVIRDIRQLDVLQRMVENHRRRAPRVERDWQQEIWGRIPWASNTARI